MRALTGADFGRVAIVGALAIGLASTACKRQKSGSEESTDDSESASKAAPEPAAEPVEASAAPIVRLIEQGADPLRKLHYDYKADRDETVTMDIAMTVEIVVPGLPSQPVAVPSLRLGMHLRTTEVSKRGARYHFELTQAEIIGQEDSPPMLLESMQSARDQLLGLRGEGLVDRQGVSSALTIDPEAGLREDTQELVESAKRSLNQMSAPIPTQPVGIGAIWEIRQTLVESGVEIEQISTVKLLKIDGSELEMAMQIGQTAKKQKVRLPGVPDGQELMLNDLKGHGEGKLRVSLGSFVPDEAHIDMQRDSEVLRDGRTTTMILKSKIDLTRAE